MLATSCPNPTKERHAHVEPGPFPVPNRPARPGSGAPVRTRHRSQAPEPDGVCTLPPAARGADGPIVHGCRQPGLDWPVRQPRPRHMIPKWQPVPLSKIPAPGCRVCRPATDMTAALSPPTRNLHNTSASLFVSSCWLRLKGGGVSSWRSHGWFVEGSPQNG